MQRLIKLDSSMIESCSYHAQSKNLLVVFKSGDCYVYEQVPNHVYQEFMKASSFGTFLNEQIKNSYHCDKLFSQGETDGLSEFQRMLDALNLEPFIPLPSWTPSSRVVMI